MKKYVFAAVLSVFCFCLKTQAQTSLLATLYHEGNFSTFYGATALQQAHAAAAAGDVITLSSGSFASVDITKAITLRGAGMFTDTVTHTEPTVLLNDFTINVADTTSGRFTMEGIYSNQTVVVACLKNAMFLKCRFNRLYYKEGNSTMKDLTFIHCRIATRFGASNNTTAQFVNSVVIDPGTYSSTSSNAYFSFLNCYVTTSNLPNTEYKNCIMIANATSSTAAYYNNMIITDRNWSSIPNSTNVFISPSDTRVAYLKTAYADSMSYILTDELKALVKGMDGKEIGIYGGNLPYSPTPSNPQITKFNVAAKTTADGKLSVDIEVNSAD